jgi:transcriptional regulator with XRE-family HTH domain
MTGKKTITLAEYKEKLSGEYPEFAAAMREEESGLAKCRKVREELKQIRESVGMKQRDVADVLQMSQSVVSRIEQGQGDIGLMTVWRYASALGVEPVISFVPKASAYEGAGEAAGVQNALQALSVKLGSEMDAMLEERRHGVAHDEVAGRKSALYSSVIAAVSTAVALSVASGVGHVLASMTDRDEAER